MSRDLGRSERQAFLGRIEQQDEDAMVESAAIYVLFIVFILGFLTAWAIAEAVL